MGSKERREREKQELREAILDAARDMFVSEGYEAVTMRSLAKRIEYSPTAIYLHFKDKEALLDELCNSDLAQLAGAVQKSMEGIEGVERLFVAARTYVGFAMDHQAQYQLLFLTKKPEHNAAASVAANESYQNLRQGFAAFIEFGFIRDDLKDPDLLAQVYFCGLHGIVANAIGGACHLPGWRDPATQANFFVSSLLKGIAK